MDTVGPFYGFCPTNKVMVGKVKELYLFTFDFLKNKLAKEHFKCAKTAYISPPSQ